MPPRHQEPWWTQMWVALLERVTTPRQAFSICMVMVVGVLAYKVSRDEVVLVTWRGAISTSAEMTSPDQAAPTLIDMLRELEGYGAVAASVTDWDVERNRRVHLVAINREGRRLEVSDRVLPIIRNPSLPSIILPALLAGEVPCVDPMPERPVTSLAVDRVPPDIRQLSLQASAVAYCVAAVSASTGVLMGAMTVLFNRTPVDQRAVASIMRRHSHRLLHHNGS